MSGRHPLCRGRACAVGRQASGLDRVPCSYDRFRDVFRIVVFDSLTSHSDVLEGRLEDGRLTATNLETGTTWKAKGQTYHTRELIYDLEPDRFKVDRELSTDGGEIWFAAARFVYTRQTPDPPP